VIALIILQILLIHEYSIITLYVTYAISYGLWIIILAFLAAAFFSWYRYSNKDIMVLILALSMIAYVINGIAGLAKYSDMLI
jgi:O-antigen/teichoic acid export membrane protein